MIALNRIAIKSGIGVSEMQRLVSRLNSELYNAANGSKESAAKFKALGLSVRDLVAMDPASQLQAVARAALETGIPLQTLTELFGERLGPRAMVALKDIAENGLPAVNRALGEQADALEALGSKWTGYWDEAKAGGLAFLEWLGNAHETITDWLGGLISGPSEAQKKEMQEVKRQLAAGEITRTEFLKKSIGVAGRALADPSEKVSQGRAGRESEITERRTQRDAERQETASQMVKMFDETQQKLRDSINAEYDKKIAAIDAREFKSTGRNIRSDSMAAVGGFVGGSRAGVGAADKQLQLMIEAKRRDEERLKLDRQRTEDLARVADATTGGAM